MPARIGTVEPARPGASGQPGRAARTEEPPDTASMTTRPSRQSTAAGEDSPLDLVPHRPLTGCGPEPGKPCTPPPPDTGASPNLSGCDASTRRTLPARSFASAT